MNDEAAQALYHLAGFGYLAGGGPGNELEPLAEEGLIVPERPDPHQYARLNTRGWRTLMRIDSARLEDYYQMYMCPGYKHWAAATEKEDGPPEQIPHTTNPIRDGWQVSKPDDQRFHPLGRPAWICPECYTRAYDPSKAEPEQHPQTHWDQIEI